MNGEKVQKIYSPGHPPHLCPLLNEPQQINLGLTEYMLAEVEWLSVEPEEYPAAEELYPAVGEAYDTILRQEANEV